MAEQKHQVVVSLTYERYQILEKKVGHIGLSNQSSAIEAGYQLGVQAVLRELRNGYVVGIPNQTS